MTGDWTDYAIHPDGRRERVGEGRNLIVNTAYVSMALAVATGGVSLWWAVGNGNTSDSAAWDAGIQDGTLKPATTDTKLANETFRKAILPADIVFVNAVGVESAAPTNRIRLKVTLDFTEANGSLREFAVYGGKAGSVTAANPRPISGTKDSGYLFNRKLHRTYEKLSSVQLERQLIITF